MKRIIFCLVLTMVFSVAPLFAGGGFPELQDTQNLLQIRNCSLLELEIPYYPTARHVANLNTLQMAVFFRLLGDFPQTPDQINIWNALHGNLMQIRTSRFPRKEQYDLAKHFKGERAAYFIRPPDYSQVDELGKAEIDRVVFEWSQIPDLSVYRKLKNFPPFHVIWRTNFPDLYEARMLNDLPLASLVVDNHRVPDSSEIAGLNAISFPFELILGRAPNSLEVHALRRLETNNKLSVRLGYFPNDSQGKILSELGKLTDLILEMPQPYPYNQQLVNTLQDIPFNGQLVFQGQIFPQPHHIPVMNSISRPYAIKIIFRPEVMERMIAGIDLDKPDESNSLDMIVKHSSPELLVMLEKAMEFQKLHNNPGPQQ